MHLLFDGHLDLALNALDYERDLTQPLDAIRQRELPFRGLKHEMGWPLRGTATVSLPQMRRAGVAVCVTTLLARAKENLAADRPQDRLHSDWPSQTMAHAIAHGHLAYYRLLESLGEVRILQSRRDLDAHWAQWQQPEQAINAPIGLIVTLESADPIVEPAQLAHWRDHGVRTLMLAHFGHSHYAAGTPSEDGSEPDGPLTEKGVALLHAMAEINMPLDLTHLSPTSFAQAVETFDGVIYSSHTNCRKFADGVRQYTDEQIRTITGRGGVLGLALCYMMIRGGWRPDQPHDVQLTELVDHADHICQLAGSANHVAIGSDLDGGFGKEACPVDLDTIADLQKLGPMLVDRGFSDADVAAFRHGNWLRFWRENLPEH